MDKESIVVIGREYGSGGREIGRLVAGRLGIPYYDRELLSEAARRHGLNADLFATADERRPSALRSLFECAYCVPDTYGPSALSREGIYKAQSDVIRSICAEGGAVIVGRTADYVMRDHPKLLSVFIHASDDTRAARIIARGEASDPREALELAHRRDRRREEYYNYFTGRRWGHASTYHLSFDASRLPTAAIAELIVRACAEKRKNEGSPATG